MLGWQTELLDTFAESPSADVAASTPLTHLDDIGFGHAEFSWGSGKEISTSSSNRKAFTLGVDGEVSFKRGAFNLIIGPTGSGKTSVLMALLGEMHSVPSGPGSWFNLPRAGGVAYATQESWVQNETIKVSSLLYCEFLHLTALPGKYPLWIFL